MVEENETLRLRDELIKSQRNLKLVETACTILICILLIGWFASYLFLSSELNLAKRRAEMSKFQLSLAEEQAEMNKFEFYYASRCKQRYGVDDLESYLDRWQWSEGTYVSGRFDCSEMSAYLEWRLENEGYHTYIVCGKSPSGGSGRHSWLLVETSKGKYMPVEATQYDIIKWSNPYFDNYFDYDRQFETIQDALDYNDSEFDWWRS